MKGSNYLVIIPSVGDPDTLLPCLERMVRCSEGAGVRIVVALNPVDPDGVERVRDRILSLSMPAGVDVEPRLVSEGPCGFAAAVNRGLFGEALPPTILVVNDDVAVTHGWLDGLRAALDTDTLRLWGEPPGPSGRPQRDVAGYGRIGVVGPVSDNVAGIQAPRLDRNQRAMAATDPDAFAAKWRESNPGSVLNADFLSGFCLAFDRACLEDLMAEDGRLFWEAPIGGFEDNDLAVRAERLGWRCAVAAEVFIHHKAHQTLDRYFPGQQRGMRNRLAYYQRHAALTQGEQSLVVSMRLGFTFTHDLKLLAACVRRLATLADGLAVVLTNNPLRVTEAWDWERLKPLLDGADHQLLQSCSGVEAEGVGAALSWWLARQVEAVPGARLRTERIRVEVSTSPFNERDERNRAAALAESIPVDGERWLWSVDHDEVVEDRITRAHLDRLMRHPDPLVRSWDLGWLNHWGEQGLVRIDPPWADGERCASGMRGFRIWRASSASPRRIQAGTENGLHCGNCPDHAMESKRVAALRFRHFGYLRREDRHAKAARYRKLDPTPDPTLIGGDSYAHLTDEEGMMMSAYMPQNGIGLLMLAYAGEPLENVAHWLDLLHGVADHAVIVWTDEEAPPDDYCDLVTLFGAELIHHPMRDHLGETRNAGLDWLRMQGLSWAMVIDPDERAQDGWSMALALRRMAERADTYGWLVEFANLRPAETGEPPTASETVRLVRLDPEGVMRYNGRVHETFDGACGALRQRGVQPALRMAPFRMVNPGLALDDLAMEQKLRRYQRMLLLELEENPRNAGAWVSLALQYANDGAEDLSFACLLRAATVGGAGYLGHRELAMWHLRHGRKALEEAAKRLPPSHRLHGQTQEVAQALAQVAPPLPLTGLARRGQVPPSAIPPLPAWPAELGPDPAGPLALLGPARKDAA